MRAAGWRVLGGVALLLVAGCRSAEQPRRPAAAKAAPAKAHPAPAGEVIRVGAWNIEWLGRPQRRSGPAKGHAQTPAALAEYVRAADVDILGLEEIAQDVPDRPGTNRTVAAALRLLEQQTGDRWRQRVFPARGRRDQCCGIAWNTARVTAVGQPRLVTAPEQLSLQGRTIWSRPPYGMLFAAGEGLTDFVVVVIHMKSDYRGDFSRHRTEEAVHLMVDLPQAFQDGDVLIIGDSNCDTHDEPAVAAIESAGFVDLNAADTPTHWRYGALDRAFAPAGQPEFADRYFEVLSDSFLQAHQLSGADFKVSYSDHFMAITHVAVMADDD